MLGPSLGPRRMEAQGLTNGDALQRVLLSMLGCSTEGGTVVPPLPNPCEVSWETLSKTAQTEKLACSPTLSRKLGPVSNSSERLLEKTTLTPQSVLEPMSDEHLASRLVCLKTDYRHFTNVSTCSTRQARDRTHTHKPAAPSALSAQPAPPTEAQPPRTPSPAKKLGARSSKPRHGIDKCNFESTMHLSNLI